MCVHLFVEHCCVTVFIRVLNSRGWSQPQNHFNSEIFPVYSIDYLLCLKLSWRNIHMPREERTEEERWRGEGKDGRKRGKDGGERGKTEGRGGKK